MRSLWIAIGLAVGCGGCALSHDLDPISDGPDDPCVAVAPGGTSCTSPPESECVGSETLRTYSSPGTCSSGECGYSYTDTTCASGCAGGACLMGEDAVELATGYAHTCARRASGAVACWGNNYGGQLGDGTTTDRSTPAAVSGLTDAVELATGGFHTCARRASGAVACWGLNYSGQLGDGTTTDRSTPVPVTGF